jgi:diacylglycerol O-acyltransferase
MVERLAGIDALALSMENSTMPAHVVALVVLEASADLSHRRLQELVGTSLPRMARFRSRVVNKPLGWGQPVWSEVENFDPAPHLRSASIPAPGGQRGLTELIAELSAQPLDRRRPLWEAWTIDGLDGGQWVLALKMAPAITGGVAGLTTVWRRLLSINSQDDPGTHLDTEPSLGRAPSRGVLVRDTVREAMENQITGALLIAGAAPGVLRAGLRALQGAGTVPTDELPRTPSSMRGPVPRTIFNKALTDRRATAFASIPLAQIRAVTRAFGGSVNNVVLAACTLSLRTWLDRHDTVPDHPLSLQIPLPPRDPDSAGSNNRFTFARLRFPVQLDDPVRVLTDLHTATEKLTIAGGDHVDPMGPITDFATVASLVPPTIIRAGMRIYGGLGRLGLSDRVAPISHGIVSTLPGLRVPLYCAGVKVAGMHAAAPLIEGAGLNITLITHGAEVDISVCVCPDNVPAVDEIATGIAQSIGVLVAAAESSPRGVSPSVVTEMSSHTKNRP